MFRELWFTAPPEGQDKKEVLIRRVTNITAVVSCIWCCDVQKIKYDYVFDPRLDFARSMSGLNSCLNRYSVCNILARMGVSQCTDLFNREVLFDLTRVDWLAHSNCLYNEFVSLL